MAGLSESLSKHKDGEADKKIKVEPTSPSANLILESVYKWVTGSGRLIWFTATLTTAYKPEMKKGSHYFNVEVDFTD